MFLLPYLNEYNACLLNESICFFKKTKTKKNAMIIIILSVINGIDTIKNSSIITLLHTSVEQVVFNLSQSHAKTFIRALDKNLIAVLTNENY